MIGTGFMVSPSLLLTNHHVFPRLELARNARVVFDFEDDERGRQLSPSVFLAQPDRFYLANERLDFALVAVDRAPGHAERWGTIPLRHSPGGIATDARVCIMLDAVPDSGDLGWFNATGLTPPSLEQRAAAAVVDERVALDWLGGAEYLDPGYWDLAPVFPGYAGALGSVRPKLEAIAAAVDEARADFLALEGMSVGLREPSSEALEALGQTTRPLGKRALLCLDPAMSAEPCGLDDAQSEIAAGMCNNRPVLPEHYEQLALTLARDESSTRRGLILLFVELEPARDLPSRAHRNELAHVLGELAMSFAGDVVIAGTLAGVLDQPGLRLHAAPPELSILATPINAAAIGTEGGALAWIGDGHDLPGRQIPIDGHVESSVILDR